MSEFIQAFSRPTMKINTDSIIQYKKSVFNACFNIDDRKNYSYLITQYNQNIEISLKKGVMDSLGMVAELFTRHSHILGVYDSLLVDDQRLWISNFRKTVTDLNEPVSNFIHFIIPTLYSHFANKITIDVLMVLNEIYDDMEIVLHTILICMNHYNTHYTKYKDYAIQRIKEVLYIKHHDKLIDMFNPLVSPLCKDVTNESASKVLMFVGEFNDLFDEIQIQKLISKVINGRIGMDTSTFYDDSVMIDRFVTFIHNGTTRDIRGLLMCLLSYYKDEDYRYVLAHNKKFLFNIKKKLNEESIQSIEMTLKLINIFI